MSLIAKALGPARKLLSERAFTDAQIEKLLPKLHHEHKKQPELLGEIIDTWNMIMNNSIVSTSDSIGEDFGDLVTIPATATPSLNSLVAKRRIDMNTILAEVEPDLLLLEPEKLVKRHNNIKGLGLIQNSNEYWLVLFNAPRGFYLQDWKELAKKVYYIEENVLDFLYDKKEQKAMTTHPLVKSAASVEADFDHIRTRYLFARRAGYKELSHMFSVQTMLTRPKIKDLILTDNDNFLERFAPYCTNEEYSSFANLIKNHEIDESDADVSQLLADLETVRHKKLEQLNPF